MKFITISSVALIFLNQVLAKPADGCLQVHTVIPGDNCYSVAQKYYLSEDEFYNMNPGLHHSAKHMCDNLDDGKPFCVCMEAPCPVAAATNATRIATAVLSPSGSIPSQGVASASASASATVSMGILPAASSMNRMNVTNSMAVSRSSSIAPTQVSNSNSSSSSTNNNSHPQQHAQSSPSPNAANKSKILGSLAVGITMAAASALF